MKIKDLFLQLVLVVATLITLINSVEHHSILAESYGEVANIFVPAIALSSFLLGAFISLLFQWGINVVQFEQLLKLLPNSEGKVLRVLFAKRKILQSDLVSETGLSGANVSRILSILERKGIISKKPIENTNLITSKLYRMHSSTQILTKLPGVSERRILIAILLVFFFGLSLTAFNSFHVLVLGHPLEFVLYPLAIEFFALGGLANLLLRKRISYVQFNRILDILPKDEGTLLKIISSEKSITQKDLVDKTGIYKMKVSRILQKFEQKGIIERKPYGYTNMILSKI